jgi:hypothetical protein
MKRDRWAWLEGVRPISAAEAIARELAKLLRDELASWPPRLDLESEAGGQKFAPLYAPGAPRPSRAALAEGFRLARWDLAREHEAIAHYLRNGLLERAVAGPPDALAAELVWRYVLEACLETIERTDGRVRRAHLLPALDDAYRALSAD